MYTIATLHDLRRQLGLADTDTNSDQDLLQSLQNASHLIESLTQRRFCPLLQTRAVPLNPIAPRLIILPDDLLEVRAASDASGQIDLDRLMRVPEDPDTPASVLGLPRDRAVQRHATGQRTVTITGIWGWHDRWTSAWTDSADTIGGGALSATDTTISVSDTSGSDAAGLSPRFQIGHLLRINDEYLRLTAIDRQNHQLTVRRAAQGTVAATHPQGAKIATYTAALPIRDLTARYAQLMLKSHSLLNDEPSPLLNRLRRLTA